MLSENQELDISLPLVNGSYGNSNLICQYKVINVNVKNQVRLFVSTAPEWSEFLLVLYAKTKNQPICSLINSPNIEQSFSSGDSLMFFYFSQQKYPTNPFTITLRADRTNSNIIIIVVVSVVYFLLCVFCLVAFLFRYIKRRQNNMPVPKTIKSDNRKAVEDWIKKELKPIKYTDEWGLYNTNCSICLEDFDKHSKVCLTQCHHVFHHNCLVNWWNKNVAHPKCPNCNWVLTKKFDLDSKFHDQTHERDSFRSSIRPDNLQVNNSQEIIHSNVSERVNENNNPNNNRNNGNNNGNVPQSLFAPNNNANNSEGIQSIQINVNHTNS